MPELSDIVICEPVRTPVGSFGGQFKSKSAVDMGVAALTGLLERTGIAYEAVEDVIFAQCYPTMEAPALGRVVALDAGLPVETPGIQIDRRCGSGLQAVIYGVMTVATGGADLVVVGGAESMTNAAFFTHKLRWGVNGPWEMDDSLQRGRVSAGGQNYPVPGGMIETAENLRAEYSIPREEQDEFAFNSHRKAAEASDSGKFADEIISVTVVDRKRGELVIDSDEHIRRDITLDKLATLKPIMGRGLEGATVTAGNASGQNDGGSAAIVCTRAVADKHGLKPFATLKSWAVAGVAPKVMGIGPVPSTSKALERAGLTLKDLDLIELNEAFAAQAIACLKAWEFAPEDYDRLNVNGSGISLGHPVGATGGRIMATLLREMERRNARYSLETMCIGGGQGLSAIFEKAV
ncbi:acetyl-CoA C-acyltransferase [Erythrobacter litoralis]|uniref:acetyl-CoA C-acetyltransferase n=1 Tax=Erythrobacter litoralis TaxID=39960 RepID=UPI002434DB64|nr:acetyl-CoA C-acetyltransferase [Erythrobacter litoralis]MDG6079831.1 acetyl-CoA C-acyltransferase [Erythrobacter litoralis]